MPTDDIQVVVVPFNSGYINESVVLNADGSYTIFINDTLSPPAKQKAYLHALWHITNGDFFSELSINELECIAHAEVG